VISESIEIPSHLSLSSFENPALIYRTTNDHRVVSRYLKEIER